LRIVGTVTKEAIVPAILHRRFIDQGAASERTGRKQRLGAMLQFAESRECRRKPLLAYFGEVLEAGCGNCDNCCRDAPLPGKIDRTREAVLVLSCARLTDQLFGQEHLIQILRGSRAEKITRRGHDKLPVYGSGKERSPQEWHHLIESLLDENLLKRDPQFGSLRLTSKAFDVLDGKEKWLVAEEPRSIPHAQETVGPPNTGLLQKLKALRKRLADEARMPAFYIFSDRSLLDIAQRLPQNREQFLAVHGVGELKMANYGQRFLDVIRDHCLGSGEPSPAGPEIRRLPGTRVEQTVKLFQQGQTVEQIATSYQVHPETVISHLQRFQQTGGSFDPQRLLRESKVEPSKQARVFEAFQQLGPERLAPVYQRLGATVPYQELHLLRLYWLSRSQR
jgi:ATP-dependent DNA helicase RecQ